MLKKKQLMKRTLLFLFLIGLFVGSISIMHVKASGSRSYFGYVSDRVTHRGIKDVYVTLRVAVFPDPTHGEIRDSVYTNSLGYYYVSWSP